MYSKTEKIEVREWGNETPKHIDGLKQMYDDDGTQLYWNPEKQKFESESEILSSIESEIK